MLYDPAGFVRAGATGVLRAGFVAGGPTIPSLQVFCSKVEPLTETIARVQNDPRPKTTNGALQALDWLIYGNLSVGGAYDSNVFASPDE
jgi:hypothetical protein